MIAFSAARLAANFSASLARLMSRLIRESLATLRPLVAEREAGRAEKRLGLFVRLGRSSDADVQTTHCVDFDVLDFGEDHLLFNRSEERRVGKERRYGRRGW